MSRKIRNARRGGLGLLFDAMRFYGDLLFLMSLGLPGEPAGVGAAGCGCAPVCGQVALKGATLAFGFLPLAISLPDFNQQRVKLIKQARIGRQVSMKKLLCGSIPIPGGEQLMPRQDSASVGIGDEKRMIARIEQDGVCRFRAHPAKGQQLRTREFGRLGEERVQGTTVGGIKPLDKGPYGACFLPEISRRADAFFDLAGRSMPQTLPAEKPGGSKTANGPRSILPVRILSKDGAEDDLQASACRPPALGTEMPKNFFVIPYQHFTRLNSERLSRALHRLKLIRRRRESQVQPQITDKNQHLLRLRGGEGSSTKTMQDLGLNVARAKAASQTTLANRVAGMQSCSKPLVLELKNYGTTIYT